MTSRPLSIEIERLGPLLIRWLVDAEGDTPNLQLRIWHLERRLVVFHRHLKDVEATFRDRPRQGCADLADEIRGYLTPQSGPDRREETTREVRHPRGRRPRGKHHGAV